MYINESKLDNMTYSIDKIRLKTYIDYTKFTEIEFRFKTCWIDYVKKNWNSPLIKNFYYNYDIEIEEGKSFWFGFLHNTERRTSNENTKYNFTIEFNPNKIQDNKIIKYLLEISGEWFLIQYDLAIDINISILDIITDISGKREEKIISKGFDNKTIYIGKGDGRIKIYNKKIESKLDIQHDLTRVEITRTIDNFNISEVKLLNYDNNFPNLYLNKYIYSLSDYKDKTLFAILFAVQNGFPIKNLSRVYREKIRNLLEGGYKIKFSNKLATDVLRKTIFYYFMKNPKVRWR